MDKTQAVDGQRPISRRGILECFYGPPWSVEDRRSMVAEAASWGMNFYCYGPSGDRRTGTAWREPYDSGELAGFAALVGHGAEHGVEIGWRVSPSAPLAPADGIAFHDKADVALLLDRIAAVVATGVRTVLVTFDDVEHGLFHPADRTAFRAETHPVAVAHARLANAVADRIDGSGADLVVCPTRYWGTDSDAYSRVLADSIAAPVQFCWTGPRVTSPFIDGSDAAAARARHGGRPLLLWDNYPVNDWDGFDATIGYPAVRRLFLGPLRGRTPHVAQEIASYAVNCGPRPWYDLPAVATAAMWAADPDTYDPDVAWQRVLERYDDSAGSLALLASLGSTSPVGFGSSHPVATAALRYLSSESRTETSPALRASIADARTRLAAVPAEGRGVLPGLRDWAEEADLMLSAADAATRAIDAFAAADRAGLDDASQWLADRRQVLDRPLRPAVMDSVLEPLIERGRGLAGAPVPAHDV